MHDYTIVSVINYSLFLTILFDFTNDDGALGILSIFTAFSNPYQTNFVQNRISEIIIAQGSAFQRFLFDIRIPMLIVSC